MIVTIDGPAGSGKSTAARSLAKRLQFDFLDTGAMYRAVALLCLKNGIDPANSSPAAELARKSNIEALGARVLIDGVEVTNEIRTSAISTAASRVAAIPGVREALVEWQRRAASARDVVTEGRDQGTVVFPNALCKFYITASAEVRARRRQLERASAGECVSYSEILKEIVERDTRDKTRDAAPLRQANDALRIDTSAMSPDEVVEHLETIVRQRMKSPQ